MSLEPAAPHTPDSVTYRAGDLLIDVGTRRVTRAGTPLDIAGLSFDLLLALVRAAPNLLSTQALMDQVWPGLVVGPETVTQRVKLLRQGLGDDADNPRYVAAVRGHGYRLIAAATQMVVEPESWPERTLPRGHALRLSLALAGAVVVGAAGMFWINSRRSGAPPPTPSANSAPSNHPSVAVMPFANLTGDSRSDYLGDGMAEELINSLAQVPGLKVPARTSAFAYKGRNTDIRRIGQDLGVATVLEGSVRRDGERLRVGARLVDAASGFEIWSQDYERKSADLFALQDDLATQIVQALRGYMNPSLPSPTQPSRTTSDVQAYDLYLQGREIFRGTRSSSEQALEFLDQALERDPNFANALAERAALRAYPAIFGSAPAAAFIAAERDATRALALSPNSPDAHTTMEMMQAIHWHWADAENSYRATMTTSADDPYFRDYHITFLLRAAGRLKQAESELLVSYHLGPTDGYTLHELIVTESLLGHDAEAIRYLDLFRQFVAKEPPVGEDALPYLRQALRAGRNEDAAGFAGPVLTPSLRDAGATQVLRMFCQAAGAPSKRAAADRALREFMPRLVSSAASDRVKMYFVSALTMIGDLDAAYDLTRQLLNQRYSANGSGGIDWGEIWAPEMRPFRRDARFKALMMQVKLPDYWARFGGPDNCDFRDDDLSCR